MAEFNFQRFTQGMQVVAEELPLLAGHPIINNAGQINQLLVQILGQLGQLGGLPQQVAAMQQQLGAVQQQQAAMQEQLGAVQQQQAAMQEQLGAMPQQLQELEHRLVAKMQYYERLAHARALNASALQANTPLHPLPLPNGDPIPPQEFPANIRAFRALNGNGLTALLRHYELAEPHALEGRIQILADYFGIQPH